MCGSSLLEVLDPPLNMIKICRIDQCMKYMIVIHCLLDKTASCSAARVTSTQHQHGLIILHTLSSSLFFKPPVLLFGPSVGLHEKKVAK